MGLRGKITYPNNGEIHRNKDYLSQKNDVISHSFDENKVSRLSFKSGIVFFLWRVTWYSAYTPFNVYFVQKQC